MVEKKWFLISVFLIGCTTLKNVSRHESTDEKNDRTLLNVAVANAKRDFNRFHDCLLESGASKEKLDLSIEYTLRKNTVSATIIEESFADKDDPQLATCGSQVQVLDDHKKFAFEKFLERKSQNDREVFRYLAVGSIFPKVDGKVKSLTYTYEEEF